MTDWKAEWSKWPCSESVHRWPNKHNSDEEIGSGCDQIGCINRPDLLDEFQPKGDNEQ
jgi:hypothetical protein